ncbi:outer membrane beta-barrel protein [Sphingobium sp. AS12]|uniref:outer membrane beta-barrel protein n=1 Tax=Sphingobium sp. AS12 TaxID=2849495 RepID=UPI001C315393|nr:outer membrane beta-barrel protein [Sphingobium sp. AS12]MBV2149767.1 outer membrane beta-barrel protein [Sphingobium sp. AS12]
MFNGYEPIGGRIGSFFLFPELRLEGEATDNVLATETNQQDDVSLNIRPVVSLTTADGAERISVSGFYDRSIHADFDGEDTDQFGSRFFWRSAHISESHTEIELVGERHVIGRESVANVDEANSPIHNGRFTARVRYKQVLNRLSLEVEARGYRADFADALDANGNVLDQDFRDYTVLGGIIKGRYLWRESISLVGFVAVEKLDYDLGIGDPSFDPLSTVDRDSVRWQVEGGVGFFAQNGLYGDVTVGYLERTFNAQPIQLNNIGGFSFTADLLWNVNPITTLRLTAGSEFIEAASRTLAGYRSTSATLEVQRAIMPNLVATPSLRVSHLNPIGPAFDRTEYSGNIRLDYVMNRRWSFFSQYRHSGRNSNDVQFAYNGNWFNLGTRIRF